MAIKIVETKMQKQKYHTVTTIPKSYRKIVEQNQNVDHNTLNHHRSLSGIGTGTSLNSDGVRLVTPSWWNGAVMHVLTQVFQKGK